MLCVKTLRTKHIYIKTRIEYLNGNEDTSHRTNTVSNNALFVLLKHKQDLKAFRLAIKY